MTQTRQVSSKALWVGRILSALALLFLLFDSGIKFTNVPAVRDSMTQLGYPVQLAPAIGILEICCIVLYLIPQTSVLGAILMTGYLGGAIASHVRVGNPLFSHILFPTYIGALIWAGLYLREARLRSLVPFRS